MKVLIFASFLFLITANNLKDTVTWNWNNVYTNLVALHNKLRKKHKSPSLTKSTGLAKSAKKSTDYCVKKSDLVHTAHTYKGKYTGQNLYLSRWDPPAEDIVRSWY